MRRIRIWRRKRRTPQSVWEFLDRALPGGTPQAKLKLMIVHFVERSPDTHQTLISRARRWGMNEDKAAEFLRGETEFGFQWPAIEGMLTECGAQPAHLEVAHSLFHRSHEESPTPLVPSPAPPADDLDPLPSPTQRHQAPGIAESDTPSDTSNLAAEPDPAEAVPSPPSRPAATKPDPLTATTPAQFIDRMWAYHRWMGEPSYREIARQAGSYSHTSFRAALNKPNLPKLRLVLAFIEGCGGDHADLEAWENAWRHIRESIEHDIQS